MKRFFILPIIFMTTMTAVGQELTVEISGPSTVDVNTTHYYYAQFWKTGYGAMPPPLGGTVNWYYAGGNMVNSGRDYISGRDFIQMNWTTTGNFYVLYHFSTYDNSFVEVKEVTVIGAEPPPTPNTTFSIVQNCGNTVITRNTDPYNWDADYEWWWQTVPSGTSTSEEGNAESITLTANSSLYLRARTITEPYLWSIDSRLVGEITIINTPPAKPASVEHGHGITNGTTNVSLSVSSVSGATGYRWYNQGGVLISNITLSNYSPSVSQTSSFYVSSVTENCESIDRIQVTAYVHPKPVIAGTNNGAVVMGSSVTLSVTQTYDEYQWLTSEGEIIPGATAATFVASRLGQYRIQVKKGNSPFVQADVAFTVSSGFGGQNMNYIVSNTILQSGVTSVADIDNLTIEQRSQTVQYFDGLGRSIQTVSTQASPKKADIVQPIVYDEFGRQAVNYLPYTGGNNGLYKTDFKRSDEPGYPASPQAAFYLNSTSPIAVDTRPFSETIFEPSPLNRPVKQFGPGADWHGSNKFVGMEYLINQNGTSGNAEQIIAWDVNSLGLPIRHASVSGHITNGYFETGQLFVNVTKDEAGHQMREYTNKEGQVILKKVQAVDTPALNNNEHWASTYYIYDDFGNLVFVLPPEAVKALTK